MRKRISYRDFICPCGKNLPIGSEVYYFKSIAHCSTACTGITLERSKPKISKRFSNRYGFICQACYNRVDIAAGVYYYKGDSFCSFECARKKTAIF